MLDKKKFFSWLAYISLIVATLFLISKQITKDIPGESVDDLGSEHVTDIADVIYNSNPPTSGKHFPMWAKKGVYDRLLSDGYLIHSLEHGYIIIWYDCTKSISTVELVTYFQSRSDKLALFPIFNVLAHDEPAEESTDSGQLLKHMKLKQTNEMSAFTPDNSPDIEISLPDEFKAESCKNLVSKLSEFVPKFERVIVVPRVGMDTAIALTAWNRIEKLDKFDESKILEFIKAFHNKGPEKTVED